MPTFRVALRGEAVLTSPRWNKGTAFTLKERRELGLVGRLPFQVDSLDLQCTRAYEQLAARESPILKNAFLQSLKDQNWVLYYTLLSRHLKELIPIIYTPTEAEAISNYSHLFRRSEGLYLSFPNADTMEEDYLAQTRGREIDLVVCSDAEAILGIGDQGVGGIGISSAKSAIYTLIGGMDPSKSLPVTLDVGTNNQDLLPDPLYVGWPNKRVRGEEYDQFVGKFVQLVRKHHPHSLLHFEDFGVDNAQRLLDRYRPTHAVFNDDIQGTGAVTLSAILAALHATISTFVDQRIIIYGAGSAGLGIARQLRDAILATHPDVSREQANMQFWLIDKGGLLHAAMPGAEESEHQHTHDHPHATVREGLAEFVRPASEEWVTDRAVKLLEVVRRVHPTVLVGCSTHAGGFTEEVLRAMAENVERPIVLPLSNPSRLVEVDPADASEWTDGKALLATGSPFPPVKLPGGGEYVVAECNNALIYPGLGFGTILARARELTDTMILAGAQRLAALSPALNDDTDDSSIGALLPDFGDSPHVNFEVGIAVAEQAIREGVAGVDWGLDEVRKHAEERRWMPVYGEYVYDPEGDA